MKYPKKIINNNWSVKMSDTLLITKPRLDDHWNYDYGVCFRGLEMVYHRTGEQKYIDYIKKNIDLFVQPDGTNIGYFKEEYNLDFINNGKALFILYQLTQDERYKKAVYTLREQFDTQPRNSLGGYWHKGIYPYQMWLDSIYMGPAFLAQFAVEFNEPELFDDITHQVKLIYEYTKDTKTGLLYHAWDEKKVQPWCDKETGLSEHFWGRAIGWYVVAITDILDYLPLDHPDRNRLIEILRETLEGILKVQDEKGVWYQILDQGDRPGNYLESSCSCMFVYAMLKGARMGYLSKDMIDKGQKAYAAIIHEFVETTKEGYVNLNKICWGAGLGGANEREGDYAYYISEPILTNVEKGIGIFIQTSVEYEMSLEA